MTSNNETILYQLQSPMQQLLEEDNLARETESNERHLQKAQQVLAPFMVQIHQKRLNGEISDQGLFVMGMALLGASNNAVFTTNNGQLTREDGKQYFDAMVKHCVDWLNKQQTQENPVRKKINFIKINKDESSGPGASR